MDLSATVTAAVPVSFISITYFVLYKWCIKQVHNVLVIIEYDREINKIKLKCHRGMCLQYMCIYNKSCTNPIKCPALNCYGKLLHTVITGWDDKECIKTFETIGQNTHMLRKLNSVVKYKPGTSHYPED